MKLRLAKSVAIWSVITSVTLFVVFLVLWFVLNLYSAVETPLGYVRLWLSPGHDVTRHVNFVLSAKEGPGRQVSDKILLLEILELDARWGSRLRYDRTVLIKYAGYDMVRARDHMNYLEPMKMTAAAIVMSGPDADLVKAAFDHYANDEASRHSLCSGYAALKASGDFYNPAAVTYCRDTPVRNDVRKMLFD